MSKRDQDNFVGNVVGHLGAATSDVIKKRQAALFAKVDHKLGHRIARGINVTLS
jgi:catalase